jgi:hypothetical protein
MIKRQARRPRKPIAPMQQDQGIPPDRLILSPDEAAAYLGCRRFILDNLRWDGIIPPQGEPPSIAFSRAELDAWLAFWRQEASVGPLCISVRPDVSSSSPAMKMWESATWLL